MKHRGPEEREDLPPLFAYAQSRAASEARRDCGMARVQRSAEDREHGWEADAVSQVREHALAHEHFATEDVRARYGTPEGVNPKAWGPVMKRAQRDGIVEPDGFVIVNCSNRSPRVRWRSLVYREAEGRDAGR